MSVTVTANPFNLGSFVVDEPTPRYMTLSQDGKMYRILMAMPQDPQHLMCHCLFIGAGDQLERHEIGTFTTFEPGDQLLFQVGVDHDRTVLQATADYRDPPLLLTAGMPEEELVQVEAADFKLKFEPHFSIDPLTVAVPREILQDLDASARAYRQVRGQRSAVSSAMDSAYACQMITAYNRLYTRVLAEVPKRQGDTDVPHWLVSAIRRPVEAYRVCEVPDRVGSLPGAHGAIVTDERWDHCDQVADAITRLLDAVDYARPT